MPGAILHVQKYLCDITRDPAVTGVFFETGEGNRRVLHVARKLRVAPAGARIDALKLSSRDMFHRHEARSSCTTLAG